MTEDHLARAQAARLLEEHTDLLSGWERSLLTTIAKRDAGMSEKQAAHFNQIIQRCSAFTLAKAHGWVPTITTQKAQEATA
jgi:hypothetical protein